MSSVISREIRRRPLTAFVILTFLISWVAWGVLAVFDLVPRIDLAGLLWLIGGLGPPIAALLVSRIADGPDAPRQLLRRLLLWRVEWRWYAVAVLLPGLGAVSAIIIGALVWDIYTPIPDFEFVLLFVGLLGYTMIIGGGLEEIGWRGFALPRLQASYSALTASLVVGVIWMVWHAPLFAVPGASQTELPVIQFFIQGIALAVIFTWLYNSTRGSLLFVVIFHGAFNAWLSSVWILRDDINPSALWIFTGVLVVIAVSVILVHGRDHLSQRDRQII